MNTVLRLSSPFRKLLLLSFTIFLVSCASSYKPFRLRDYEYSSGNNILDSLAIAYAPGLQGISDNGWYARKERKYKMTALAVRIENSSSTSLTIGKEDLRVSVGDYTRKLFNPEEYSARVKQRVGIHLLHTLYGPWITVSTVDQYGRSETDVYFIPVGAVIGIINATKASKANRANAADIRRLQIWNKPIKPGEIMYGIILVEGSRYDNFIFYPSE
jgi:hypothetical protein